MIRFHTCSFVLLFSLLFIVEGHAQVYTSGVEQNALLEMYSSQGCSSCPPAEEFVTELRDEPSLWSDIVPVVFHVTYWDYLGWKDTFGEAHYKDRQSAYARKWYSDTIYTPGFALNGEEWRDWRRGRLPRVSGKVVGELRVEKKSDSEFVLTFESTEKLRKAPYANLALLGFDLDVQVLRGENRGRTLRHDFTVLNHEEVEMKKVAGNQYEAVVSVKQFEEKKLGFSAWVTKSNRTEILQSTGAYL